MAPGTSGGDGVTSGRAAGVGRTPRLTAAGFVPIGFVYMIVNASSTIDERRALGLPIEPWRAWVWEGSSLLAWLCLLPLILVVADRLTPARRGWPATLAGHALALAGASVLHSALMFGLRVGAYAAIGDSYAPSDTLGAVLVYEFRKDVITYLAIVAAYHLIDRLARPAAAPVATAEDRRIEVRDGSRSIWLRPDEIDLVAAQGNYVEIRGRHGARLARRTLAELERELATSGFVRVHRSSLVRKAAVVAMTVRQTGDFDLTLASGETVSGSRRFRQGFEQA